MRRPMIPLAIGIAVPDEHARLARLEADAPLLLAAFGTAVGHSIAKMIHDGVYGFRMKPLSALR